MTTAMLCTGEEGGILKGDENSMDGSVDASTFP